jgi:type I restriction enzyme S subunit
MISILLPSNKEQKRIANFLSIIDAKIESVNQQISQAQTFKKGLLQQLFV